MMRLMGRKMNKNMIRNESALTFYFSIKRVYIILMSKLI